MSALLDTSASARTTLIQTTNALSSCALDPATASTQLAGVVALRRSLLVRSRNAPFTDLPSGVRLRALLTQAWTASLTADEFFLQWAQGQVSAGGCTPGSAGQDSNYVAAGNSSQQAGGPKTAFSQLWNATIASRYSVPPRSRGDF
jgi:hypothetical protein